MFVQDLRQRVLGAPEISTDGFHPYKNAIRDAFNGRASHGVVVKTYSVTNLYYGDSALNCFRTPCPTRPIWT